MQIELVWYDFSCMPQHIKDEHGTVLAHRTALEEREFKLMLQNANLIYLLARCLLLVDNMYPTRFWTQFEAYLSMQELRESGLQQNIGKTRRYYAIPLHGMNRSKLSAQIKNTWERWKTSEDAIRDLSRPDCEVTNASDKTQQIAKLERLCAEWKKRVASSTSYGRGKLLPPDWPGAPDGPPDAAT